MREQPPSGLRRRRQPCFRRGERMMGLARFFLMGLALVSLAATFPSAALGDQGEKKHVRVSEYGEGHAYCPPRDVVIGNMAVQGGRCYQVAVVRNTQGA